MPKVQHYPNTPAPQATSKSGLFFAALVLVFSIAAGVSIATTLTKPKPTAPANTNATNSNAPGQDFRKSTPEGYTRYSNAAGKFSLNYPKNWQQTSSKVERFSGADGFFQVQLVPDTVGTIDQVAELEKTKKEMPYGSAPEIVPAKLSGNEALLIRPSSDQPTEFTGTGLLLITLPEPQTFEGTTYPYLALWADMDHMQALAESLKFE